MKTEGKALWRHLKSDCSSMRQEEIWRTENFHLFGNGVGEGRRERRTWQGYLRERGFVVERTHGIGGVYIGEGRVDTSRSVASPYRLMNVVGGI